jgi:hypothetical protein
VLPKSAIKTTFWTRRSQILDQGQIGSCVPNAGTGVLGTDSKARDGLMFAQISVAGAMKSYGVFRAGQYLLSESEFALPFYTVVTSVDSYPGIYPPDDTGSDGLSCAKALQRLGLASGYSHAFTLDALKTALMSGPVMWGTVWYESMFDTNLDGFLLVDSRSGEAGGHELVISGYDLENSRFLVVNSWGLTWGISGTCWVHEADMVWLLSQEGDITVPVWAVSPAPRLPITDQQMYDKIKDWFAPGPAVNNRALKTYADLWAHDQGLS